MVTSVPSCKRKAAGILSIEKDDNPEYSVVKALKVRDGSPLDVPMMLFGWDKAEDMHVYRGEKSKEDKKSARLMSLLALSKKPSEILSSSLTKNFVRF